MRITPLDVRKQEFRRSVRGFDCDEVRAFLTTLADEYEAVLVDNKQIRERLGGTEEKVADYKTMERTLRDTLMTAERLMQDTRESANKESELIIQDARLQSKRILEECRVRTEELRRELNGLRKEKEAYLARFKVLAETQIQFVENHRSDFDDLDKRLIDMVDTAIEGMGARTFPSAGEPAPPTAPTAAPAATPVPAVAAPETVAWMNPSTAPVVAPAPAAPAHNEVDRWRNYDPDAATAAPAVPATPVQVTPAQDTPAQDPIPTGHVIDIPAAAAATMEPAGEPETEAKSLWSDRGQDKRTEETSAIPQPERSANGTDLAAPGRPLPAGNSIDGSDKAVETLVESTAEKANSKIEAPWGG